MKCKWPVELMLIALFTALMLTPALVQADAPATRPTSDGQRGDGPRGDGMRGDGQRGERPRGPGPGRGMGGPNGPMRGPQDDGKEPTSDEIAKAEVFLKEYSPNRYGVYASIPQNRVYLLRNLRNRMVKQYRRLMDLKIQQPDMYDAMIVEQKLVDDAVGLMIELRDGKEGAEDRLKAKLAEIVDNQLAERKTRIEKLESMLAEQKEQLSRDEARKEELATQRREQLERDIRIPPAKDEAGKDEKSDKPDVKPKL